MNEAIINENADNNADEFMEINSSSCPPHLLYGLSEEGEKESSVNFNNYKEKSNFVHEMNQHML
jgi:hypothetical protein